MGRKLTVLEEVILRNQTRKRSELAEVEQNIKREQNRRKGKRMERLKPEEIPEGREREEEDGIEERVTELDEEGHWKNLMAHRDLILRNQKWMSAGRMEASSLEEQRLLAYGKKQEVSQKDVWKFWEVKAGSHAKHDDVERSHSDRDAMETRVQEGRTTTSQLEGRILLQKTTNEIQKTTESEPRLQKPTEEKILLQKTKEDIQDIHTLNLVNSMEDSSMFAKFAFKFGRQEASKMQKTVQEVSIVDNNPGKIHRRVDEIRAKPMMMKDAGRTTGNNSQSQERSPGLRGRVMMKKLRCTPQKIKKISQVSTLKHFFENATASSLTRGPLELLLQSTQGFNPNLGERATTTTRDAMYGRKVCVSQSDTPIGTGPRQTDSVGLSLSQDWTIQTWRRDRGPMGDALPGLGERKVLK